MSRPQKMHKPVVGDFNNILAIVGMGSGKGKKTAIKLAKAAKKSRKKPTTPIPSSKSN